MKKILFLMLVAIGMISCQKTKEITTETTTSDTTIVVAEDSMMQDNTDVATNPMYCCEKHPEVQGSLNDKCLKCGMPLTKSADDTPVDSE